MEVLARLLEELGVRGRIGADNDGYPWIFGYRGPHADRARGVRGRAGRRAVEDQMMIKSEAEVRADPRERASGATCAHRLLQQLHPRRRDRDRGQPARQPGGHARDARRPRPALPGAEQHPADGASAGYRGQIGRNAAIPHALSGNIDVPEPATCSSPGRGRRCGATTRSSSARWCIGEPSSDEQRRLFEHMKAAQEVAFEAIRPGARCADVDRAVRGYYEEHDLMHVLEAPHRPCDRPALSRGAVPRHGRRHGDQGRAWCSPSSLASMTPGLGGFRHSDTVLVTDTGLELDHAISARPRELDAAGLGLRPSSGSSKAPERCGRGSPSLQRSPEPLTPSRAPACEVVGRVQAFQHLTGDHPATRRVEMHAVLGPHPLLATGGRGAVVGVPAGLRREDRVRVHVADGPRAAAAPPRRRRR